MVVARGWEEGEGRVIVCWAQRSCWDDKVWGIDNVDGCITL